MRIDAKLLKRFYDVCGVRPISMPKYYNFCQLLDGTIYPEFTSDKFLKFLGCLWADHIDMNFDTDSIDAESLIHLRSLSFPEAVLSTIVDDWENKMELNIFNRIRCYARETFKGE